MSGADEDDEELLDDEPEPQPIPGIVIDTDRTRERIRVWTLPHACVSCGRTIRWARLRCWDCR